ncbi:MAG: hypothetical protein QOC63_642 [Mycobacterium sp.]|nr:hypothetical protein [Mycobacterium sp.]
MLLAATHSVAVLVRTRAGGLTYWCALTMTLTLASCAFVLSFDALWSLAVTLGLPETIAWLWPCAIDVAIAQATLCLLSLSRRATAATVNGGAVKAISTSAVPRPDFSLAAPVRPARRGGAAKHGSQRNGSSPWAPDNESAGSASATVSPVLAAGVERWQPVAESLVREGVTSKDPQLVAAILAQREAGILPSVIGRHHNVHHTTVRRILSAAQTLTA